ncbi:MAG: 6-hydroxymethylpterin diphosphokinase MptE-like protein [Candidatus Sifarchaeia archaeon]
MQVAKKPKGNLSPVRIRAKCVADAETIQKHVEYCTSLDLPIFYPRPEPHDLEAVLVGSAPSVKTQISSLKKKSRNPKYKIYGIKGGHDFLIKNKIEPDFALAVDPLERIHKENFLLKAENCTYFIASQCHPTLFDTLIERGEKVVIWHLLTDSLMQYARSPESPIHKHYLIPGGSTSGLRALFLSHAMGFRKMHLYGYDSCLSGVQRKVNGETYEEKKPDGTDKAVPMIVGGKKFMSDPAMASQANEFQDSVKGLWKEDDPIFIKAYGEGLIQQIVKERYKEGAPECLL